MEAPPLPGRVYWEHFLNVLCFVFCFYKKWINDVLGILLLQRNTTAKMQVGEERPYLAYISTLLLLTKDGITHNEQGSAPSITG